MGPKATRPLPLRLVAARVATAATLGALATLAVWVTVLSALPAPPARGGVEPVWLVTREEAALPDPPLRGPRKELDGGPVIRIASPENNGVYEGAFPIEVSFHPGPTGEAVDLSTLQVTYRKAWGIDITSRLSKYLSWDDLTIKVPDARLPSGRHSVEIYIEDVADNPSSRVFTVEIGS